MEQDTQALAQSEEDLDIILLMALNVLSGYCEVGHGTFIYETVLSGECWNRLKC